MKIFINGIPLPMYEDQETYPIVSIETVGNRCILRAEDKETLDEYKSIISTSSYRKMFDNDDYLIKALSADYGLQLLVVGRNGFDDKTFSKNSSQLRMSTAFKYKK